MSVPLNQITAVVLAGGFGTRIQHLLPDLPKPMAPVLGRPFIEWVVRFLKKQGVHDVVLSTGYLSETIRAHFATKPIAGTRVQCIPETQPLGTAGGFLNAAQKSGQNPVAWLVLNGDSLAIAPISELAATLDGPAVSGAILGVPMEDAARYGTLLQDSAGRLVGFSEKRPGAGVINAGIYLLRSSSLRLFPAQRPLSFERDVFPALIERQLELKVFCSKAPFLDIGTPESLPLAEAFIRDHLAQFGE